MGYPKFVSPAELDMAVEPHVALSDTFSQLITSATATSNTATTTATATATAGAAAGATAGAPARAQSPPSLVMPSDHVSVSGEADFRDAGVPGCSTPWVVIIAQPGRQ